MNQKERTKTFMMISNLKNSFGCDVFYKVIQRFKGYYCIYIPHICELAFIIRTHATKCIFLGSSLLTCLSYLYETSSGINYWLLVTCYLLLNLYRHSDLIYQEAPKQFKISKEKMLNGGTFQYSPAVSLLCLATK